MGEPSKELSDTKELLLGYLDHYRSVVEAKLTGLSEAELRNTRLPSGWTPLELLKHLVFMERRWLRWGFAGEPVDQPWGDSGADPQGRWQVDPDEGLSELLGLLRAGHLDIVRELADGSVGE